MTLWDVGGDIVCVVGDGGVCAHHSGCDPCVPILRPTQALALSARGTRTHSPARGFNGRREQLLHHSGEGVAPRVALLWGMGGPVPGVAHRGAR